MPWPSHPPWLTYFRIELRSENYIEQPKIDTVGLKWSSYNNMLRGQLWREFIPWRRVSTKALTRI
jgi:hypothetical protein